MCIYNYIYIIIYTYSSKSVQNMFGVGGCGFCLLTPIGHCFKVLKELQASLPMLTVLQGADGGVVRHLDRIQGDDLGHPISPLCKYHHEVMGDLLPELEASP